MGGLSPWRHAGGGERRGGGGEGPGFHGDGAALPLPLLQIPPPPYRRLGGARGGPGVEGGGGKRGGGGAGPVVAAACLCRGPRWRRRAASRDRGEGAGLGSYVTAVPRPSSLPVPGVAYESGGGAWLRKGAEPRGRWVPIGEGRGLWEKGAWLGGEAGPRPRKRKRRRRRRGRGEVRAGGGGRGYRGSIGGSIGGLGCLWGVYRGFMGLLGGLRGLWGGLWGVYGAARGSVGRMGGL